MPPAGIIATDHHHLPKKDSELAGVELLRFFSAFVVLVWHYQHFFYHGAWEPDTAAGLRPTLPLYSALSVVYDNGSLAVPVFWAISGFIFYWYYAEPIRSGAINFSVFLVRRFSRLYPLHFATLLLVAVGQYVYFRSHHETFIYSWNKPIWFASQLLLASNWFTRQPLTFNGPIWSVSIEVLVYLSFFAVAFRFGSRIWVAALFAAIFALCSNLHSFVSPDVFSCGMYFFLGGVARQLYGQTLAMPAAVVAAIVAVAAVAIGRYPLDGPWLLVIAISSVIVMTKLGQGVLRVPFRHLSFLGNATYASYLLHFPVQLLLVSIVDAMGWTRDIFFSPFAFVAFLTGVVGISLLVHRHFEMPAQALIRAAAKSRS